IGQNLAAVLTILAGGLLQQSGKTLRQPSLFSRAACCSNRAKPCGSPHYSRGRPAAAIGHNLAAVLTILADCLLQHSGRTLRQRIAIARTACCLTRVAPSLR